MKNVTKETTNVLLSLPSNLNGKLQREAEKQCRKRHAQIIFILEKFFETAPSGKKEKAK